MTQEYNIKFQEYLISFMLSSSEAFARCQAILSPNFFDGKLKKPVKHLLEYVQEHRTVPPHAEVNAKFGTTFEQYDQLDENKIKAFLKEVEEYCRHKAIENVIHSAPDLLTKGEYGTLEKDLKDALLISLQNDLGTEYFSDPKTRLLKLRDKNNMVSTGWKSIDQKLYGGVNRGEITLFAGNSGAGKSLFLQNISLNWVQMGLNVIYITAELSELLTAMRIDSMLTHISTRELFKNLDTVELKIKMEAKRMGRLQIKYLPPGTTSNGIKAYLKEFEIQTGVKPDAIVIDYLDLLYPNNTRINPSDLFVKDKFVTEELRALAVELNLLCISASQLNRSAVQETEYDQSMIAGGISKINTADNVIAISTSDTMKQRGEYKVQFLKTRSSSGVGSKVLLAFNMESMRISDLEGYDENARIEESPKSTGTTISDLRLKRVSTRTDSANSVQSSLNSAEKPESVTTQTKLLALMNKIKS
jgi:archaellum biogenesis ATPase FlaH